MAPPVFPLLCPAKTVGARERRLGESFTVGLSLSDGDNKLVDITRPLVATFLLAMSRSCQCAMRLSPNLNHTVSVTAILAPMLEPG